MLLAAALALPALADSPKLPEPLAQAEPNTWVALESTKTTAREYPVFFYAPTIDRFVRAGGGLHYKKAHFYEHYDTEELNLAAGTWANAYPEGLGKGRPASGKIGGFSLTIKDRYDVLGLDGETPRLTNRDYYRQYAWAGSEGKLYLYDAGQLVSYDPRARAWAMVSSEGGSGDRWAALAYNPVHRELVQIGGHPAVRDGTWTFSLAGGKWRKNPPRNEALAGLVERARALQWATAKLLGSAANRFSIAETDAEAKVDLGRVATGVADELDKCSAAVGATKLSDREKPAGDFARKLLADTAAECRKLADRLGGKIDPPLLAELRNLRAEIDRVAHVLAPIPTPRANASAAYDPQTSSIVVFGGDGHDRVLSDTWVYDCQSRTWSQRFPEQAPLPRAGAIFDFLPDAKTLLLAGGYSRVPLASDLWTYDVAANRWKLLAHVPVKQVRRSAYSPGTPHADHLSGPLVGGAAPGDVLAVLEPNGNRVWAIRIDTGASDAENQATLAVAPASFTFHSMDPGAWEKVANPDAERMKKFLADLPANQWTSIPFARPAPGARNRWGTTAYDPDRHQFLFWGGGHATSKEDDVAHFSLRGGCWTISYPPTAPLNPGSYMSWGGMSFSGIAGRPAMPWAHAYQAYAYDPSGLMFLLSHTYDVHAREWTPTRPPGLKSDGLMRSAVAWTPHGVVCLSTQGLYQFDAEAGEWKKLPWEGPDFGKVWCDGHALFYDRTRDCLWAANDRIFRYDFKTGKAERLDVTPPAALGKWALWREQAHLPEADLVLLMRPFKSPDGKLKQVAWEPSSGKYYWVDLTWLDGDKQIDTPGLSWACALQYDPEFGVALLNDSRHRRVWALRFDRKSAGLEEIVDAPDNARRQ